LYSGQLTNVKPTFDYSAPAAADDLKLRQGWYCEDLLSGIYLAFYLFITEGGPVRRFCEACGQPIKSKRALYCNATCRSNARHERSRRKVRGQGSAAISTEQPRL